MDIVNLYLQFKNDVISLITLSLSLYINFFLDEKRIALNQRIIVDSRFLHASPLNGQDLFLLVKKLVLEKLKSSLILFYFKRENKIRKKILKK